MKQRRTWLLVGSVRLYYPQPMELQLPTTPPPADTPPWPLHERLDWLKAFTRQIITHERALTAAICDDVGKPQWQALTGDVMTLLAACKWHRKNARRVLRERAVGRVWTFLPGTRAVIRHYPIGTVAIIATWNYPVQLLGIQLLQALLAGNRVIVKPSERAPTSQGLMLDLAVRAGLPAGRLTWTRATREHGPALLQAHEQGKVRLDHVVFTGSTAVGRQIALWGGQNLVSTTLELSGNDSAIVLADADLALAARSIFAGLTLNSGQTCLAPRRVLVDERVYAPFVAELEALLTKTRGNGAGDGVIGHGLAVIDHASAQRCDSMAREAMAQGGRELAPAVVPAGDVPGRGGPGFVSYPARVIVDCPPGCDLATSASCEHFGPVLAVLPVRDEAHLLRLHASCTQHLMTSIFSRDASVVGQAWALVPKLVARGSGGVSINDCVVPGGHPGIGITGHGRSGWGTSRGADGLLALTRPVAITVTGWPRLPVGPIAPAMLARMRSGLRWMFS